MGQFYNFKRVQLVHIGVGSAAINGMTESTVEFTDDLGEKSTISLIECARISRLLREAGGFPPNGDDDWGNLATVHDFATLGLLPQPIVGLRGAIDRPPWFQFLNRRRTQFEFKDYDHIQTALLQPLNKAGNWYSWDAS